MSLGSIKPLALGLALLALVGLAALVVAKRHDKRLALAKAVAVAALSQTAGTGDGLARGIRIPLYEGEAKQPASVMLGRTAEPVDGGKYIVTEMRVENYTHSSNTTVTNFIIEAPKCLIDPVKKIATSEGRIVVTRPDGTFMTTGIGFEWRQLESVLTITNQVMTHLTRDSLKPVPSKKP
ncbi:MAG: hypothetical protein EBS05_23105 [Proteobacteria bacterium]|nr:hypothetical protein [Pseudomonadota bacterium]